MSEAAAETGTIFLTGKRRAAVLAFYAGVAAEMQRRIDADPEITNAEILASLSKLIGACLASCKPENREGFMRGVVEPNISLGLQEMGVDPTNLASSIPVGPKQ